MPTPALLHKHVHAAERVRRELRETLHLLVHRDIAALAHGLGAGGAKLGHRGIARGIVQVRQHQFHSGARERARHTEADAAGAAGDDSHFSSQVLHGARAPR